MPNGDIFLETPSINNADFFKKYAKKGTVCLFGGIDPLSRVIRDAQALVSLDGKPSLWSHAAVLIDRREDDCHWLLESDISLNLKRVQLRNGAQENRVDKYADPTKYPNLAILDFGLDEDNTKRLVGKALDLVVQNVMYPISGLLGSLISYAFRSEDRENVLNNPAALYCSAFVKETYLSINIDLFPGVATTNTSPDHIYQTPVPHKTYLIIRDPQK